MICYIVGWMKTHSLTVSSFASTSLSHRFSCPQFYIPGYFEIIRCTVKSLVATSTYFLLEYNWNKTFGAPKPVYRSLKRSEYVIEFVISVQFFSFFFNENLFIIKTLDCSLKKNTVSNNHVIILLIKRFLVKLTGHLDFIFDWITLNTF